MPSSNYKPVFRQFKAKVSKRSLNVFKDTATELSAKLIKRTPQDTSRARANWLAGINTIEQDFDEAARAPGGRESIDRAKRVIAQLKLGNVYSLANSTPYIFPLENGWSKQAPAGMRDITAMEFQRIVQRAVERQAKGRP